MSRILPAFALCLICATLVAAWFPFGNRSPQDKSSEMFAAFRITAEESEATVAARNKIFEALLTWQNSENATDSGQLTGEQSDNSVQSNDHKVVSLNFRVFAIPTSSVDALYNNPGLPWSCIPPQKLLMGKKKEEVTPDNADQQLLKDFATQAELAFQGEINESPCYFLFVNEQSSETFSTIVQSSRYGNVLWSPQITMTSGEVGIINDLQTTPYCVGTLPLPNQPEVEMPLIIETTTGMIFKAGATVNARGNIVLKDCGIVLASAFADAPNARAGEFTINRNNFRIPNIKRFNVNIPEIEVPAGMRILMAFPGISFPSNSNMKVPYTNIVMVCPAEI